MSSGLLFLNSQDFQLNQGKNGTLLTTKIPGLSLLLFCSPRCPHSNNLLPIFKKLPTLINGCNFGIINVSKNRQLVQMSQQSITPITYVPYILLFVNGKPYMVYNGPHTEQNITEFVVEVANKLPKQSKEKFISHEEEETPNKIPEYSLGVPLFGKDNITYLTEADAYKDIDQ